MSEENNMLVIGQGEFHMIVAARIRPFNKKEVKEYRRGVRERKKQQQGKVNGNRTFTRNPFGPGLDRTVNALDDTNNDFLLDDDDEDGEINPTPIMDVEDHNTSIILYDPSNAKQAKAQFYFDRVFSSFAPTVELDLGYGDASAKKFENTYYNANLPTVNGKGNKNNNHHNNKEEDDTACIEDENSTPEKIEGEQIALFNFLGKPLIEKALEGYNCCVLAYGQTGSGKTYTMMGTRKYKGLIPRLCHELFAVMNDNESAANRDKKVKIDVSYMEIYNEQVRDLLKQRPKNVLPHFNSRFDKKDVDFDEYQNLKVRNHPVKGPFVDGLTTISVTDWESCRQLLNQGNQFRTQASTAMNANSSRSHAIFQLVVTLTEKTGGKVRGKAVSSEKVSKINLVDLAGSERQQSSQTSGKKHVAEANSINVSLSTLRRVIEALTKTTGNTKPIIPYRESLLTYVLSDNFGGNSLTVMCANISPSENNVNETESTLRYATLARNVQNRVKINESPQAKVIRELKEQMKLLQDKLQRAPSQETVDHLNRELTQYQQNIKKMQETEKMLTRELNQQDEEKKQREALLKSEAKYKKKAAREAAKNKKLLELLKQVANDDHPELLDESILDSNNNSVEDNDDFTFPTEGSMDAMPASAAQRKKLADGGKKKKRKKTVAKKRSTIGSSSRDRNSVVPSTGRRTSRSQSGVTNNNNNKVPRASRQVGTSASSPAAYRRKSSTPLNNGRQGSLLPAVSPRRGAPAKKTKKKKKEEEITKEEEDSEEGSLRNDNAGVDRLKTLKQKQKNGAPLSLLRASPMLNANSYQDGEDAPVSAPAQIGKKKKKAKSSNPHRDDDDEDDSTLLVDYGNMPGSAPAIRGKYNKEDNSPIPRNPFSPKEDDDNLENTNDLLLLSQSENGVPVDEEKLNNINHLMHQINNMQGSQPVDDDEDMEEFLATEAFLTNVNLPNSKVDDFAKFDTMTSSKQKMNGAQPTRLEGEDEISMSLLPQEAAMATRRPQRNSIVSTDAYMTASSPSQHNNNNNKQNYNNHIPSAPRRASVEEEETSFVESILEEEEELY